MSKVEEVSLGVVLVLEGEVQSGFVSGMRKWKKVSRSGDGGVPGVGVGGTEILRKSRGVRGVRLLLHIQHHKN